MGKPQIDINIDEPLTLAENFSRKLPSTSTNLAAVHGANLDKTLDVMASKNFDVLLHDIRVLSKDPEAKDLVDSYLNGDYAAVLQSPWARSLCAEYLEKQSENATTEHQDPICILLIGLAAFYAFLQANVTGPLLTAKSLLFVELDQTELSSIRNRCLSSLDVDGLSVYQHIPHVELFWLARQIFTQYFPRVVNGQTYDSRWMRLRINAYHQRLLSTGPSNARLIDSAMSLQLQIDADLLALQETILVTGSAYSTEAKVQFLLEKAQIYIMQGLDIGVRDSLREAKTVSKFSYALSGVLGKRTKFQQKDTSQLVVFAISNAESDIPLDARETPRPQGALPTPDDLPGGSAPISMGPVALELNDDTLLESIEYSKPSADGIERSVLPQELAQLRPDEQPQLNALDQIILLTEATLKDTLSPLDKLNSEEILPYAVRVLDDKPTNWQIYTQALLVRSRIEAHRSRTQERSVLQLQVLVDQIIADTREDRPSGSGAVPEIQVTSFMPRAKPSESAPVTERLRYIFQLNTPTRWEIETELAYAWSNAGSLVSALEIFKRLKLYPEVALCYHSVGQEDKARQIIRRRLYFSSKGPEMDQYAVDSAETITEDWTGEIRPTPPHAPRMWCILGDLDQDPTCWQRAWDISKSRYARAQRTLGEYYTRRGDLVKAREAYMKATVVNRQNGETWSRLGDIDLRVGNWDGAIIAFQQSIMIDDSDAKTYSNLGSALISKHTEMMELRKGKFDAKHDGSKKENVIDDEESFSAAQKDTINPADLLRQALTAYKRGASLAHSNWQIWDNVNTIALRMSPPSYPDILVATRSILHIRSPTIGEEAIDLDILLTLVNAVVSQERPENDLSSNGIYNPRRGSLTRALIDLVDTEILPLITTRAELYTLISKLRLWTRDYVAALSCAEKAYRIALADSTWLEDPEKWQDVVAATENLADALENYGPLEMPGTHEEVVEKAWRSKARSALRSVIGKARNIWEGTEGLDGLERRLRDMRGLG